MGFKKRKKKAREKLAAREKGSRPCSSQFPPVLFSCLRFLNSADETISEPGTGYKVTSLLVAFGLSTLI